MRTAIDTNVLSAIWGFEPNALSLSKLLTESRRNGSVVICGAVFAEAIAHPGSTEEFVRGFLEETGFSVDFDMGEEVWTEAGRRYALYAERRRRSSKEPSKRLLADFVIGSHALLHSDRLFTLDRERYQRDFPELKLL